MVQTVPVRELGFSTETTRVEAQSRAVKLYPDLEAIVVGYERLTPRELDERIDTVAAGLGKLGLWKGRSGLRLPTCLEFVY